MSSLQEVIIEAIQDKKARDIVSLDLSGVDGAICDTFVLCTADSTTQVAAIADNIEKETEEKRHERPLRIEGKDNCFWVVLDYGDIMAHVFLAEYREFYALDELWSDVPVTKYRSFE